LNHTLLIPSARLVVPELQADFGAIPPALLPLGHASVLERILQQTPVDEALIGAHEGSDDVQDLVSNQRLDARVVDVGATDSLGQTVFRCLEQAQAEGHVIVQFADTLVSGGLPGPDTVDFQWAAHGFRWTTFDVDAEGRLDGIRDRFTTARLERQRAFIGRFCFADRNLLRHHLHTQLEARRGRLDPFYAALLEYDRDRRLQPVEQSGWDDVGHVDTYYDTRRRQVSQSRFFNEVAVDRHRGTITKRSSRPDVLRNELAWYRALPQEVAHVAPRVFASNLEPGATAGIEIEYYSYPSMNDLLVHGKKDWGFWHQALDALGEILDDFLAHPGPKDPATVQVACQAMYVDKTLARLDDLAHQRPELVDAQVRINNQEPTSLRALRDRIRPAVEASGLLDPGRFSIVHGDLCASNILYDYRNRVVRLIDPRGDFGGFNPYGDPTYDLAKLSHSFHGGYDHIQSSRCQSVRDGDAVTLTILRDDSDIQALFEVWLAKRAPDIGAIRLAEALLFLSMLPLHSDRPAIQEHLAMRGIELFQEATAC